MTYIFSFSLLIGILTMFMAYWFILAILSIIIRLIAGPLRYVYKKLFGIINYI